MQWIRPRRPSPALVISLIALFIALGGTGYAALKLPKNSVGTKQLKKNAVTGAKIKNNAVTGRKVKDHSLSGADLNLGALGTVPSATNAGHAGSADNATNAGHAGSADNATHANSADNASTVGGKSPSDFASAAQGLAGYVVVDPSNGIVQSRNNVNGGSYTLVEGTGNDTLTAPFSLDDHVAVVSTGSARFLGGTSSSCITSLNGLGSDQVLVQQVTKADTTTTCDEEYTIFFF